MTLLRRPLLTLLLAGLLLPLVPLLLWALSARWRYPALVPQQLSGRGLRILTDPRTHVLHGLLTSTLVGVSVAALACAIGLPAGRAIGAYRFRGRRLVQFLLLAPVIVPGLAVTLGIQVFFVRYGLAASTFGVVLVQLLPTVPYAATVLGAGFANLDLDYEFQARPRRRTGAHLVFVTIPLLRPALILAALFCFLISWSEYVLTLLVGGGQVQTLPLLLFAAIGSSDTTAAAALGVLVVAPPLLLVAAAGRLLSGRSAAVIGLGRL